GRGTDSTIVSDRKNFVGFTANGFCSIVVQWSIGNAKQCRIDSRTCDIASGSLSCRSICILNLNSVIMDSYSGWSVSDNNSTRSGGENSSTTSPTRSRVSTIFKGKRRYKTSATDRCGRHSTCIVQIKNLI